MSIQQIIKNLKKIQKQILIFINEEENIDFEFHNLQKIINNQQIQENKNNFHSVLTIISKIAENHCHVPSFYDKIDRILTIFKSNIKKTFTNNEIFNIFRKNKRTLLFLIEEKILPVDQSFVNNIFENKYQRLEYPQYFAPEINPFLKHPIVETEISEEFFKNRKKGENEKLICELIRNDSIEEFIIYINENNISLNSKIEQTYFETNKFLIEDKLKNCCKYPLYTSCKNYGNKISLIKYAAFFGSIQIFKYLINNEVSLKPSLWKYAIHGNNPEIIDILEENHITLNCEECFIESVKCHHNEIALYIQQQLEEKSENDDQINQIAKIIKFYNFNFLSANQINESAFYYLCRYNNILFVDILIKTEDIDINKLTI